ncbi:MAG: RAD55 family ATPase [Melioribacteraceae bacterium]
MAGAIRRIPSGFSLIDKNWGGVYRGGSYMVVGPRKSGRTLIGLQFALEAAKAAEVCLYFTLMRPKDLMIQAASLNFDIQSYMNQNLIIVVRVAPPNGIYDLYNYDDYLVEYFNDIITVVDQYHPSRIIFDELTPFVGFKNINYLQDTFVRTLETIEERDITSLFVISEPATKMAQSIVEGLTQYVTGTIELRKDNEVKEERNQVGKVTIVPNVGHTEGQFTENYKIEPFKGVTTDFSPPTKTIEELPSMPRGRNFNKPTRIDVPSEPYAFSNVYNYNDFLLILNNQIALFKSTGQSFHLVSIKLDPAAQLKGLLTINQLQNAIRLSTSKKDKICVVDNKVIVLLVRGSQKSAVELMTNMQNNLPSQDQNYVNAILDFISVYNTEVEEHIENADTMLQLVINSNIDSLNTYLPLNKFIG